MSGLFFRQKAIRYFRSISSNLIDDIIQTPVIIYRVSSIDTETNFYGESDQGKVFEPGLAVNCLISMNEQETSHEGQVLDLRQSANFAFLKIDLAERGIEVNTGDYVEYNDRFYEVDSVIENQFLGGREDAQFSVICTATLTKESVVQIVDRKL